MQFLCVLDGQQCQLRLGAVGALDDGAIARPGDRREDRHNGQGDQQLDEREAAAGSRHHSASALRHQVFRGRVSTSQAGTHWPPSVHVAVPSCTALMLKFVAADTGRGSGTCHSPVDEAGTMLCCPRSKVAMRAKISQGPPICGTADAMTSTARWFTVRDGTMTWPLPSSAYQPGLPGSMIEAASSMA